MEEEEYKSENIKLPVDDLTPKKSAFEEEMRKKRQELEKLKIIEALREAVIDPAKSKSPDDFLETIRTNPKLAKLLGYHHGGVVGGPASAPTGFGVTVKRPQSSMSDQMDNSLTNEHLLTNKKPGIDWREYPVLNIKDPDANEEIFKEIVEKVSDEIFLSEIRANVTVLKTDKQYRSRVLEAGCEFFLDHIYITPKTETLAFVFMACDRTDIDYEFVELTMSSADAIFPMVGPALAKAWEIEDCELLSQVFAAICDKIKTIKQTEREAALLAIQEQYSNDPTFGAF